jgi:hypothetical protein
MGFFKPPLGLHSGNEFTGSELRLEFTQNRRIKVSWSAFLRPGLVTLEQGFKSAFPYRPQPAEEMAAGDAAEIGNLCGSILSPGGKLDGQKPVLTPAVFLGGVSFINDRCHIGHTQSKFGSCHA